MAGPTGARVTGLRETVRSLERLGVEASELKDAMQRIGDISVRDAKARVPVGPTGKLRDSIRSSRAKAKATVRAGSKAVYYASFQEWGTSRVTGTEYVTQAVQDNRDTAVDEIESELSKIINRLDLN